MNIQKMKANLPKTMSAAFAAAVMAMGAHGAERITVDEVANHYPWDGKVDCVTTVSGLDTTKEYEGVFTLSVKKDGANVHKTVTNAFTSADGTYTNTFDCTTLFGAGLYPNGGIAVDLVKNLGGVQLWKDGPYWAECNVGAAKPEEYGYYFMWGDTNAYVRNTGNNGWVSVKDGSSFTFTSSNNPTYGKTVATLASSGYIDSTGSLVSMRDAATAHLGDPWRMPTDNEVSNLIDKCSWSWTNNWNETGVKGYVVTGKEDGYTEKSVFLPAAGLGNGSNHISAGSNGVYWSSTPEGNNSNAWGLYFGTSYFKRYSTTRYYGLSVRPLRSK